MGYDKEQVFDLAQHVEEQSPHGPVVEMFIRVMDADQWFAKGQWYAMGRMYHEAAPLSTADGRPDEAGSAAGFALLYQQMLVDFRDRKRAEVIPLHTAWANYVTNLGGTIEA